MPDISKNYKLKNVRPLMTSWRVTWLITLAKSTICIIRKAERI